jgi:hypothetical protein
VHGWMDAEREELLIKTVGSGDRESGVLRDNGMGVTLAKWRSFAVQCCIVSGVICMLDGSCGRCVAGGDDGWVDEHMVLQFYWGKEIEIEIESRNQANCLVSDGGRRRKAILGENNMLCHYNIQSQTCTHAWLREPYLQNAQPIIPVKTPRCVIRVGQILLFYNMKSVPGMPQIISQINQSGQRSD